MGICCSIEDELREEIEYLHWRVFMQTATINRLALEQDRTINLIKQLSISDKSC